MTVTLEPSASTTTTGADLLQRLALDITRTCQAQCTHCYNQSSPQGEHGEMTREDWLSLLDQAAAAGVRQVQIIGGEPTLHPDIADLINRAVDHFMAVEVFSNLIHVRASLWPVLRQRGVTLATSYYSDQAEEHEQITKHRGSYAKTRANIIKALAFRIPLRAGIVHVAEGQRVAEATAELHALGVTRVGTDRLREIGRGAGTQDTHQITELCGHCANGRAAVLPSGEVAGCVMSGGMMTAGNVRTASLAEIVTSPAWAALNAAIPRPARRPAVHRPGGDAHAGGGECMPDHGGECVPQYACVPSGCSPDADSCVPHAEISPAAVAHDPCVPDSCTPKEDSCQPSPGVGPVGLPAEGVTLLTRVGDGCTPDEDSCQPSPGIGAVRPARQLAYTGTACNPDQDGSDCAPAEQDACEPSY